MTAHCFKAWGVILSRNSSIWSGTRSWSDGMSSARLRSKSQTSSARTARFLLLCLSWVANYPYSELLLEHELCEGSRPFVAGLVRLLFRKRGVMTVLHFRPCSVDKNWYHPTSDCAWMIGSTWVWISEASKSSHWWSQWYVALRIACCILDSVLCLWRWAARSCWNSDLDTSSDAINTHVVCKWDTQGKY